MLVYAEAFCCEHFFLAQTFLYTKYNPTGSDRLFEVNGTFVQTQLFKYSVSFY